MPRPKQNKKSVTRQLRVYLGCIRWIAFDALSTFWLRILVVTLINLFGIATTASMVGGVMLYAKHLERGEDTLSILGYELVLTGENSVFIIYAIVITLLGLVSAACIYLGEWLISRITVAYQNKCSIRLFKIISDPAYDGWQLRVDDPPRLAVSRLSGLGVRLTAFAFRNLLRVLLPFCIFVVAVIALVWIYKSLTLILLPIVFAYFLPLYLINRGVARQHRAYLALSPVGRKSINDGIKRAVDSNAPVEEKLDWAQHSLDGEEHDRAARLFWKRKLSVIRVQWANTTFFIICLMVIFVFFGMATQESQREWSEFLVFVIALQFALNGVRKVTSRMIKLSRFLPEYRAYTEFVDKAEKTRSERELSPLRKQQLPESMVFKCGSGGLWDSKPRLNVDRGKLLWILSDTTPSRGLAVAIATRLERRSKDDVDIISHLLINVEKSFSPTEDDLEAIANMDMVLLNGRAASGFDKNTLHSLLQYAAESFLLLMTDNAELILDDIFADANKNAAGVIAFEDRSILAAGDFDWFTSHHTEIAAHLSRRKHEDDLDEEEEMELEMMED